jgi:hypothetical protein
MLKSLVDSMEICIAKFPCEVETCPDVKENMFEPAWASEFFAADFVVLVDVGLLELGPVETEAAAKHLGPANVVLGRYKDLEASFSVGGREFESRVVDGATDALEKHHFEVWLGVELVKNFSKRANNFSMP